MTTLDRRLDKIEGVFNPRPDAITGDLFTREDIARAIETLEADPNPAFILGIPNAQMAALVDSEIKRIEAQLKRPGPQSTAGTNIG